MVVAASTSSNATNTAAVAAAFSILLDSIDCSASQSLIESSGGEILIGQTDILTTTTTQRTYLGSVLPIPAGIHSLTVCALGGAPYDFHALRSVALCLCILIPRYNVYTFLSIYTQSC